MNMLDTMPMEAVEIFNKAYRAAKREKLSELKCNARAYVAVEEAGYEHNPLNGLWNRMLDSIPTPVVKAEGAGMYSCVKPDAKTIKLLTEWMDQNRIPNQVPGEKLHCTILYSKQSFAGYEPRQELTIVRALPDNSFMWDIRGNESNYWLRRMGPDDKAVALCFVSPEISDQFWQGMALGGSWDFEDKVTHVTLSYDAPVGFNLASVELPNFELVFEAETVEDLNEGWATDEGLKKSFGESIPIEKINKVEQIIYGWASVIEKDGEPVVDYEGDVIDEADLVKAARDFMLYYREGHEMHTGIQKGDIVESIVFTKDLQKSLGIDLKKVGWFIGYQVTDKATWDKVEKGELREFSIGGVAIREAIG